MVPCHPALPNHPYRPPDPHPRLSTYLLRYTHTAKQKDDVFEN